MRIEIDKAVKPVRRLRKLLKNAPGDLTPEYVHELRTEARKLEATIHAISCMHEGRARRLLKRVKPFRRAAGCVRDMDVMIHRLMSAAEGIEGESREAIVRLSEDMAAARKKNANRLRRLVRDRSKSICRNLKTYARHMGKVEPEELGDSTTAPQMLTAQLQHWPRLQAGNLHEFRIQAKELRYMLQLMPETDEYTMHSFARVKDVAGEWHDWLQLHEYAEKVLDTHEDHEILRRLGEIEHEKLRAALAAANAMRQNGLAAM